MPALHEGIWILPTRKRPEGFKRIMKSVEENDPEARVISIRSVEDESTVEKINKVVGLYPNEAFYGFLSDDLEIVTKGALSRLAEECPSYGLSYCADLIYNSELPGHPCVSGNLVRALGWWAYPRMKHHFIDLLLHGIAKRYGGAVYVEDVAFQHYHYTVGTAEMDDTYRRGLAYKNDDIVAAVYWERNDKEPTMKRIKDTIDARPQ